MQTIANRYKVLEELGSGGISTVFRVHDTETGENLALKRIEPSRSSDEEITRFHREFHFLSQIDHPNIVKVFDTGVDGSLPFFTMEYLEGQTLAGILNEPDKSYGLELRRDTSTLIDFLTQICRALSHIHQQGTVHRDLKPSNLMVLPNSRSPVLKVLDLGLAKFRNNDSEMATRSAQVLGTVHYSAPEQVRGLNVDGRADLYSLGAILYEIMTGRRPFSGDNAVNVAMQHLNELPVPPRVHNLDVPHHIQLVIMKLLEKDPDRRYRSPEDLMIDLNDPDVIQTADQSTPPAPPLLLHPRFLGRRGPAAVARSMMSELRSGKGRLLTVSGEPGIGKTRFLNELCADAGVMGLQVLTGTCYRDNPSPYHAIISAIRDGLGERSLWNWVDKDDRFPLARLFPELKDEAVDAIPEEFQRVQPESIVAALVNLLRSASRTSPMILCIDDLQWADDATLTFLTELSEGLAEIPIALLASHRPYEDSDPKFLVDVEDVKLEPLSREHTHDVIGSILGSLDVQEELTTEVYTVSGGNPFTVIEAIRSLEDRGALKWKRNQWHYQGLGNDLPDRIEWLVNQRLTRLSGKQREILELAAVLGRPFGFDWLACCEVGDDSDLNNHLHWLMSHNLLKQNEEQQYELFHAQVQDSISESLSESQRTKLHERVGRALEQGSSLDQEEVGRHLAEAGKVSDAVPYVLEAAQSNRLRCDYKAAYDVLTTLNSHPAWFSLPDNLKGQILLSLASSARLSGKDTVIEGYLGELSKLEVSPEQSIRIHILRSKVLPLDTQTSLKEMTAATREAKALGHDKLYLSSILVLIRLSWAHEDQQVLEHLFSEAEKVCLRQDDEFHKGFIDFLRGHQYFERFELARSLSHFEKAIGSFGKVGHRHQGAFARQQCAEIAYFTGDVDKARQLLLEISGSASITQKAESGFLRARLAAAEGNHRAADEALHKALTLTGAAGWIRCLLHGLASVTCASLGEERQSDQHMRDAEDLLDDHSSKKCDLLRYRAELAVIQNRWESARDFLEQALQEAQGNKIQVALTQLPLGKAYLQLHEYEQTRDTLQTALEFFTLSEATYMADQTREVMEMLPTPSSPQGEIALRPAAGDDLLDEILVRVVDSSGCDRAILAVYDEKGAEPRLQSTSPIESGEASRISQSIINDALTSNQTILTHNASEDPRFSANASVVDHDIRSILCIPIGEKGQIRSVLYVDHRGVSYFSEGDVAYIESFARLAGITIERSRRYDLLRSDLEQLAGLRRGYKALIGQSTGMQRICHLIDRVSATDIPVLLEGETGTGKGLIARTIHEESVRVNAPFLAQNFGALNLELLETELFGHARGAFTGADYGRIGLFESADGGTIFLDEIGDAPHAVQVRLLQVMEDGLVRRVGENESQKVNVRVIAATHRDLAEEVSEGRFREDLFYRLRVVPITVPTLRERREDILPLAMHFLKKNLETFGWGDGRLSNAVLSAFESYPWPGNIRELENEVRRGLTLAGEGQEIGLEHVSERVCGSKLSTRVDVQGELKQAVEQFERAYICQALKNNGWNVTRTSEGLGITRVGLQRKIKRLGLDRPA